MTWTTRQRSEAGSLAAITCGRGRLVVLIHGVGLRAEAWGAQIDALARTCRVLAVDMPGHGESAGFAETPDLASYTDAIADVLDAPATVIGHSFGAMIALDMAARYPNRVTGVVALNAIYRRTPKAQAAVMQRAASLDGLTMADPAATLERWFGNAPSLHRDACRDWLTTVDPAGYRDAYRVFAVEDGPRDRDLTALTCPALFITGEEESNSTPEMTARMATLAPQGRAEIITRAAHMMPMTHAPQVNDILADFIGAQT